VLPEEFKLSERSEFLNSGGSAPPTTLRDTAQATPFPDPPLIYSARSSPFRSANRTSSLRWCRSSFSMIRAR
jgi:hypothetical protein